MAEDLAKEECELNSCSCRTDDDLTEILRAALGTEMTELTYFEEDDALDLVFKSLAHENDDMLEALLQQGTMPDPDEMAGWEYDGWSTLKISRYLKMQKFRKGFLKLDDDYYVGYNSRMVTNGINEGWIYQLGKDGKAKRWRIFDVMPANSDAENNLYPNSLLFDYRTGRNLPVVEETVRDFVVEVRPGDSRLLLGKMYNKFGKRFVFPNYFLLKRAERISSELEKRLRSQYFW